MTSHAKLCAVTQAAEARALIAYAQEKLADSLKEFLFEPTDRDVLHRRIREAIEPFLADLPDPDYLSVAFDNDPGDLARHVLRGTISIDPAKAPPEALERWRRLKEMMDEEPPHEPEPPGYGEASPGVGIM